MKQTKLLSSILLFLVFMTGSVYAAQSAVDLGSAGDFVILSKAGISTTGTTSIVGDIGVSPIDHTALTGFDLIGEPTTDSFLTSALVTGKIYAANLVDPTPSIMTTAVSDMETAFTDSQGRTDTNIVTDLGAGDISGMTITPGLSNGLYKWSTSLLINTGGSGDSNGVTIDCEGDSSAVFIFQIAQDLTIGNGAQVTLVGDCQASNIYWSVKGGTGVDIGTTAQVEGNILAEKGIVLKTGASLNGRALAQTAITLDANSVSLTAIPVTTGPVFIDLNGDHVHNEGTEQFFTTIQAAVDAAVDNDFIDVTSGTYDESVLITKPLTLEGVGTKPIVTGVADYMLKVDGTTGVVIDNFEFNGGNSNTFGNGVFINNAGTEASPIELKNSIVKNVWGSGSNGIGVEGSSYVLVHDNEISLFHKNGIRFIQSSGKFYDNIIEGESVDGTSRVQNLVNLRGGSNVEVYGNTLSNAITDPLVIPTWDSVGVLVSAYIDGTNVADSQADIHDNEISFSDSGIVITSVFASPDSSSATITNNNLHNLNWAINFEQITGSATIHDNKFASVNSAVHAEGFEVLSPGPVVDATNNYWGTAVESEIQALVYPEVDYSTWNTNEEMNSFEAIGLSLLFLNLPAGPFTLSIEEKSATDLDTGSLAAIGRFYDITSDLVNGNFEARLLFTYDDVDQNGIIDGTVVDETNLNVYYHDGTSWILITSPLRDSDANTIRVTINHFTTFGLFGSPAAGNAGGGGGSGGGGGGGGGSSGLPRLTIAQQFPQNTPTDVSTATAVAAPIEAPALVETPSAPTVTGNVIASPITGFSVADYARTTTGTAIMVVLGILVVILLGYFLSIWAGIGMMVLLLLLGYFFFF